MASEFDRPRHHPAPGADDGGGINARELVAIVPAGGKLNPQQVAVTVNPPALAQINGNAKRLTLTITNPYLASGGGPGDANLVVIHFTKNLTAVIGHFLPAGNSITLTNYKGPVALIAPNVGAGTLTLSFLEELAD